MELSLMLASLQQDTYVLEGTIRLLSYSITDLRIDHPTI
jgi:hypothetical protein